MRQLRVDLEESLYKRIKVQAAKELRTLRDVVSEALEKYLKEKESK